MTDVLRQESSSRLLRKVIPKENTGRNYQTFRASHTIKTQLQILPKFLQPIPYLESRPPGLRSTTIEEFGLRKMRFPSHRINHVSNNIKFAKHFKEIKQVEREFRESTFNKVNRHNLEHIKIEKNKKQIDKRNSYLS